MERHMTCGSLALFASNRHKFTFLAAFMLAFFNVVASARADIFTSVAEAYTSNVVILNVSSDVNDVDNNNVVGASSNTVDLDLEVFSLTRDDLLFTPLFTPGTTEFLATTTLLNSTGVAWQSFRLEIGFGAFDGTTDTFTAQSSNDVTVTNYDFPDVDSPFDSSLWSDVFIDGHVIEFSNGILNPGETATIRFTVDVPTNQTLTTFRGSALAVPEPTAIIPLSALTLVASLCIIRQRRRTRITPKG